MFIRNRGFCLQGTFVLYRCWVPVYFWKTFFYMCDWTLHCSIICDTICLYYSALDLLLTRLHYWVLHDVNYIHWPSAPGTCHFMHVCVVFLRDVMIFLLRALQELYIYACHAVYFYMMSAIFTYYALSGKLIFNARQCCFFTGCHWYWSTVSCPGTWYFMRDSVVFFYVISLVSIYCELSGNLRFYVRQCHSSRTWFHHTLRLSREIYMFYWCCLYISTLCSTLLFFIMLSEGAYFHRGFSHGMCIFWRTWCWVSLMTAWCRPVIFECEHV